MGFDLKELFHHVWARKSLNTFLRVLMIIQILILTVSFIVSITFSLSMEENIYKKINPQEINKEYKKYILVVMYQKSDHFLNKFKDGIFKAAQEKQFFVDFVNVENISQGVNKINSAVAAKVDGIIAQGIYDKDYINSIDKAMKAGIKVEFVYTDAGGTDRSYFVGYNSYDFGKMAARSAIEAMSTMQGEIALMVESMGEGDKNISGSLTIQGFKSIVDKYPGIKMSSVTKTNMDLFSGEDIAYDIIRKNPDLNAIVCTSEKDVLGVAQVVIDLNRVGDIKIIGVGVSEEIIKYIDLKVISGSFDMNPQMMSKKSIEVMAGEYPGIEYVEIPFFMVTPENIEYIKKHGGANEVEEKVLSQYN